MEPASSTNFNDHKRLSPLSMFAITSVTTAEWCKHATINGPGCALSHPPDRVYTSEMKSLRGNDAEQESLMKHFQENVPPPHNTITSSALLISASVISPQVSLLQPVRTRSFATGGTHQFLPGADGCRAIRMVQPGPSDIRAIKING